MATTTLPKKINPGIAGYLISDAANNTVVDGVKQDRNGIITRF